MAQRAQLELLTTQSNAVEQAKSRHAPHFAAAPIKAHLARQPLAAPSQSTFSGWRKSGRAQCATRAAMMQERGLRDTSRALAAVFERAAARARLPQPFGIIRLQPLC